MEEKDRNNGRYVTMETAAMVMPSSTLDQMARSAVVKRKSGEVDIWWVALMPIKVATISTCEAQNQKDGQLGTEIGKMVVRGIKAGVGNGPWKEGAQIT